VLEKDACANPFQKGERACGRRPESTSSWEEQPSASTAAPLCSSQHDRLQRPPCSTNASIRPLVIISHAPQIIRNDGPACWRISRCVPGSCCANPSAFSDQNPVGELGIGAAAGAFQSRRATKKTLQLVFTASERLSTSAGWAAAAPPTIGRDRRWGPLIMPQTAVGPRSPGRNHPAPALRQKIFGDLAADGCRRHQLHKFPPAAQA